MNKPVIGVVTKHRDVSKKRTLTTIPDEIKDVIFFNGGIAIGIIPSVQKITLVDKDNEVEILKNIDKLFSKKEKEDMIAQIKMCDGVVLSGGIMTDAYEIFVAKYCYENDIPIIGICAGQNNIVRAVGGTTKYLHNPEFHKQFEEYVHNVFVEKDSIFFEFVKKTKFRVNSRHRNVIDNPAGLTVAGIDDEGNFEVVEDSNKRCYLGIRFHPESLYKTDKTHNNIFKTFINICKNKKR